MANDDAKWEIRLEARQKWANARLNVRYHKVYSDKARQVGVAVAVVGYVLTLGLAFMAYWLGEAKLWWVGALVAFSIAVLDAIERGLKLREKVERLKMVHGLWMRQEIAWERLWRRTERGGIEGILDEYQTLLAGNATLEEYSDLREDRKLAEKLLKEVEVELGWVPAVSSAETQGALMADPKEKPQTEQPKPVRKDRYGNEDPGIQSPRPARDPERDQPRPSQPVVPPAPTPAKPKDE